MYQTVKDNLVWSKNTRDVDGLSLNYLAGTVAATYTGTATAGSTSTLTDSGAAFLTGSNVSLGDAAAVVVITGQSGSGPVVGERRTITSNTATVLTVSPNFSAAPDTGTTYRVHTADVITTTANNAAYNIGSGTIYDQNGGNSTVSTKGYSGFWQTNYATLGSTDVSLGTGTDELTQGPKFVDTSRNLPLFDTVYLSNTATAWVTATPYSVGDLVSAATSSFYGNATINYRCVTAHTSGSTTKPGSGSGWRTDWEFASVYRIREAIIANTLVTDPAIGVTNGTYIEALTAWVRKGFTPTNTALQGTASDATDIGAMPYMPLLPAIGHAAARY